MIKLFVKHTKIKGRKNYLDIPSMGITGWPKLDRRVKMSISWKSELSRELLEIASELSDKSHELYIYFQNVCEGIFDSLIKLTAFWPITDDVRLIRCPKARFLRIFNRCLSGSVSASIEPVTFLVVVTELSFKHQVSSKLENKQLIKYEFYTWKDSSNKKRMFRLGKHTSVWICYARTRMNI